METNEDKNKYELRTYKEVNLLSHLEECGVLI
jgi:hypothetical protein